MTGRASSSSSFSYQWTYDVFLNFRGEDTRNGFTGNLCSALRRKGIHTFMDDRELRKGDEIIPSLLKAIEESRMAITVFSKNYASSTFCLDELVKILRCIKGNSRLVWPIFYDVEPSDVRHQKGNYEEALAMHKKYFKANEEKLQNWKLALHEAANLSGSYFNPGHEYEHQFIEKIVNEISEKIKRSPLHIAKYPIGLEPRVLKINSLLEVESHDEVIMIGICGIGGMGKSTIARAVYNSIADQFEGVCFLHDIKENSSKLGLEHMQERMLSKTLGVNIKVEDVNEGIPIIKRRLNQKKILLILDNVDKQEQLENLVGNCDWFGFGSRIIITTRDKHLLARHGVERLYEVKELNNEESLELLSLNTFKKNQVDPSYMKVLNCVVRYAKGLPLALEIIGSHLFGKSIEDWKSSIDIYRRIPNEEVHKILKVSYDGLEEVEQEIFLDIASFFIGKDMKYVKDMVQHARGFDPSYGIGVLMDKCLINYYYGCVEMHDLIRDMGREIVRQESPNEPGKRSRLWNRGDIVHVLENRTGTNKVSVIIQEYLSEVIKVDWDGKAFKEMVNLKILILHGCFSNYLKYLPKSLRLMQCRESNCLQSLEPIKRLENLSVLDLSWNDFITQVLDVSSIPNLRKLKLDCCKNLIEIHESVGYLPKLELLSVQWCKNLRTFPHGIKLPSLKDLKLWGCPSLEKFPKILEKMEYLRELDLTLTNLELPLSCSITKLLELEVSTMLCSNVKKIITRDCNISDEFLPLCLTWFANVKYLDLSGSNFTILPPQIKECHFLEILLLHGCKQLKEIRGISPNIKFLNASKCTSLSSESRDILLSQELHAAGDKQFVLPGAKIPEWSWNYYNEGALISFLFRNKFPTAVVCFVIPQAVDYSSWEGLYVNVRINKKVIFNDAWVWHEHVRYSMLEDHIFLLGDGLRWIFERNGVDKVFLESEWNDVEIGLHLKDTKRRMKKRMTEIGIKVLKQENRREDINFPNRYSQVLFPSDSKEKDTNESEWFDCYTRWNGDTVSSNQGYNINGNEWLSWYLHLISAVALALVNHYFSRAPFSMLFGSTSDQAILREEEDKLIWHYEKLWKLRLPEEIKIFLWKAHRNQLAVKENLIAREINMDDHTCPKCGDVQESIMHNLVACPFAEVIWSVSPLMLRSKSLPHASFSSWWEGLSSSLSYHQHSMGMLEIAGFICWKIWKYRNESFLNRGSLGARQVISLVMQQVNEFQSSLLGPQVLSSDSEENDVNNSQCLTLPTCWQTPLEDENMISFSQTPLEDENMISFSLVYESDAISSNQGNHQKDNSASDCLSLQAPVDEVNRASFLDLPGSNSSTTNHQGLQQQQHLTSMNLQQIPKSSGNENVRKVKGKDLIVHRRKRRRIH